MTSHSSPTRMGEALHRAHQHWQNMPAMSPSTPNDPPNPCITVAISREAGARGASVAEAVGQRLGWPVYNRELLKHISETSGLNLAMLESADEKRVTWVQECLNTLFAIPHISQARYAHSLLQTLMSLSALGNCVIVGRGAAQVLSAERTLRIRLVAPESDRAKYIENKLELTPEQATKWVRETDKERDDFIRGTFRQDPKEACNYDLVFNMSRVSVDLAADVICDCVKVWQEKANMVNQPSSSMSG